MTTEFNLATWCLLRAERFRDYEQHEMAMYPDSDNRDMAIVEWTVRCLANPQLPDAREALGLLAEQHGLELAEAGTTAALAQSREQAATFANEIGTLTAENARLRQQRDEAIEGVGRCHHGTRLDVECRPCLVETYGQRESEATR